MATPLGTRGEAEGAAAALKSGSAGGSDPAGPFSAPGRW